MYAIRSYYGVHGPPHPGRRSGHREAARPARVEDAWRALRPGYDFWDNYLCDVAMPTALNGADNPGFYAGVASFAFLVVMLMALWVVIV